MVIVIELMVNVGCYYVKILLDGWMIVIIDGKKLVYYEYMIVIIEYEFLILIKL